MSLCNADGGEITIAEALMGVWTLRKYSDVADGLPASYPFGDCPEGLLIYTPDGFVSAVLMAPGRTDLSGNGFTDGRPDEYAAAGKGFIGYTGRYEVDEERSIVTHRPIVAFAPNMVGSVQQRRVALDGDVLVLSTRHQQSTASPLIESRLEWARVRTAY